MIATIVNNKARKFDCKQSVAEKILKEEGYEGPFKFIEAIHDVMYKAVIRGDDLSYELKTQEDLDIEQADKDNGELEVSKEDRINLQMRIDAGDKLRFDMSKEMAKLEKLKE